MTAGAELHYQVRLGLPSDAEAITAYHHQCRLKAFAPILTKGALDGYPADGSLERWRRWLSPEATEHIQVVSVDGVAIAHVVTLENEIVHLFVDPQYWRHGLGRKLLNLGERHLAETGHKQFKLHTMVGNAPAIALYEAQGWAMTDELSEDEINGHVYYEHLLLKDLP